MKSLIVATTWNWVGISRLPQALQRAGFSVCGFCPSDSHLAHSSFLDASYNFHGPMPLIDFVQHLQAVFDQWNPDLVIPGDDFALQMLHLQFDPKFQGSLNTTARTIIERSLGDPTRYSEVERKSLLGRSGVPVPPSVVTPSVAEVRNFVGELGLPVVVKTDFSFSGKGVRVCRTESELEDALANLPPTSDLLDRGTTFSEQKFIRGIVAGVAVAALNGKTLAAFTYIKELTLAGGLGPSSVVRIVDRPDLVDMVARAVNYFGFSGLGGFDLILDGEDGPGLVLEFNARPIPIMHLDRVIGVDLCGSLYAALTNTPPPTSVLNPSLPRIAIFPNEWVRDNKSPYLHTAYHDVPWDDPPLLSHLLQAAINPSP